MSLYFIICAFITITCSIYSLFSIFQRIQSRKFDELNEKIDRIENALANRKL
ncbi:MAG: hypothetical protein SFU98_04575 [Leptospiraceae bacterium]|nr:hypothetical protein [Leptospiraceae bacterium]